MVAPGPCNWMRLAKTFSVVIGMIMLPFSRRNAGIERKAGRSSRLSNDEHYTFSIVAAMCRDRPVCSTSGSRHRSCKDALGHHHRRLFAEPVDALRLGESGDRKFAERAPVVAAGIGEDFRDHDGAPQPPGDLLQPCREIDGGADAGEVE